MDIKINPNKIDKICSLLGLILGLFILSLNVIKTNVYLIALGVSLTFSSFFYLRNRERLESVDIINNLKLKNISQVMNILYWLSIVGVLFISRYMTLYSRPLILFIFVVVAIISLIIDILTKDDGSRITNVIFKILLLSIIFRGTGYFVSPYPIGSDPWAHMEYIRNFLSHGSIVVDKYPSGTGMANYYCSYPLSHLLACSIKLISNLSIYNTSFLIGTILTLSTIFVFLIAKEITNNTKISLLSMLLINFVDYHIQWSIQVIAMSFGIALFTILIYLIMKKKNNPLLFTIILMIVLFDIVWTHTVSAFIVIVFISGIYIGSVLFKLLLDDKIFSKQIVSLSICLFCIVLLLYHWMDPSYSFINGVVIGLKKAIMSDVTFIAKANPLEIGSFIGSIGFIIYFFLAIIGIYICLRVIDQNGYNLIVGCMSLLLVMLLFMAFGMSNIVPARWWSFIFVIIVIFSSIGLFYSVQLIGNDCYKKVFTSLLLGIAMFFMITNNISNVDGALYTPSSKLSWSESEMTLFSNMDEKYNGLIMADTQTAIRPFNTYLKRYDCIPYPYIEEKEHLKLNEMQKGMVIWTRDSLYKKVQISRGGNFEVLGFQFENTLNKHFNCIQDNYTARSYLGQVNKQEK